MKADALVSVVIPAYNYGRFVGATLESVLCQSFRSLDVIVIDDGSTDETADVLEKFRQDERVRIYTQSNQGCIKTMNRGVELSRGNFVGFCGSDDLWNAEHVGHLMDAFEQYPDAGLVFDNAEYFISESGERRGLVIPEGACRSLSEDVVSLQQIFIHNWITNCNFIVRRNVLEHVGLFDPDVYMIGDLHLLYRIAAHYPVYFADYVGVKIRIHGQNMTIRNPHYEYGVRCLEDIRANYPAVYRNIGSSIFARKLGRKYFRLGRYYERMGELEKARPMYWKAIQTRMSRPNYYWRYLRLSCRTFLNAALDGSKLKG